MTLAGSRWVFSNAHIQAFPLLHGVGHCQDHGRLPDKHMCKAFAQKLAHVLDSLVRTAKERTGAVGASTRADACAFTERSTALLLSPSVPDGQTPWSVFRNSNDGRNRTKSRVFVCHCLGAWDWWSEDVETRVRTRTHETTDTWDNRERDAEMWDRWHFLDAL